MYNKVTVIKRVVRPLSLKRIAEEVGVSVSTVSRVLNGKNTYASEQIRKQIWDCARTIGYTANVHAKSLRTGQSDRECVRNVSVILSRIDTTSDDPFFKELFAALEQKLFGKNCSINRIIKHDDFNDDGTENDDGYIILGRANDALIKKVSKVSCNIVGIWRNPMDFEIDEVVCDGEKAAVAAVEYLISIGHKRIGYVGDCSYESRYVGYCETLMSHRIPLNYMDVIQTRQTEAEGFEAMTKLLRSTDVSAVLCANDATAVGALSALKQAKREISVISIDDIAQASKTSPKLTTVRIPIEDMASMAVTVLLDRMNGGHKERIRVEFPCRLVERDSCFQI